MPIEKQLLPDKDLRPFYQKVTWLYVCRRFKSGDAKDVEALRNHDRFGISSWPQMFLFDPRDDRIRNLDAELRISQSDAAKVRDEKDEQEERLSETQQLVADKDLAIVEQQETIAKLRSDLKDSVQKTRELRAELSERAEESVRSEVKLREVETELSVAQASTDMISTGVLDYTMAPDAEDETNLQDGAKPAKTAS